MKKLIIALCMAFCADIFAASEKVGGITWQYYVEDGEAIIGIDLSSISSSLKSPAAIPTTTKGKVTVPSTLGGYPVTAIDDYAFYDCNQITSVVFPDSIKNIGFVFNGCTLLTSISISAGVESISILAYGCPKLSSITVAPGNRHFSSVDGVLYDYDVTELICVPGARKSLRIPASVENIDSYSLWAAKMLEEVLVDDLNAVYSSKNGLLFDKSGKTLIACPGGLTRLVIPEGTEAIENFACAGTLTSVSIPASVVQIPDGDDDMAFGGSNLSRIDVATDNPKYSSTGDMLFDKAKTTLIWSAPTSKALTIPASVVTIRQSAFVWSKDYKLQTLTFQGPPPNLPFLEYSDYTSMGGYFAFLSYYTGSLKGYYTAYESEWKAVLKNGKWYGLSMTYDPKKAGTGSVEDVGQEAGFEGAHTFNGLVHDSDVMCGMIQISTAKKDKKGNVKVSGFVMLSDGKKQTIKTASGTVSDGVVSISSSVGKLGTLDLVVTEEGFEGTLGEMTVRSEKVGEDTGTLSGTLKLSYFDAKTGKIKTKSYKVTGVTSDGEAIGGITLKDEAKTFEAVIK